MASYNQNELVWIDGYHGIRTAKVVANFPKANQLVVEEDGKPEIVEGDRVFTTEIACCAAAAMRIQNEVAKKMERVAKLSEKVAMGPAEQPGLQD